VQPTLGRTLSPDLAKTLTTNRLSWEQFDLSYENGKWVDFSPPVGTT
jgi:hypothetical protein